MTPNDTAADFRFIDAWLREQSLAVPDLDPSDDDLLDVAAMMAAHDDNPFED